ncbi:hypothetical protein TELCIR_09450 [Teladorsagia circumcincta]|uniref:Uncharacterized protein n=1 Tax=Teladorsagia circumcincta TaxID=45464 RepID=A0A2G9UET6_TELCI|nr:hypothetical protein TELCIR_09450 [Teladorsagia circumcincta]
MRQQLDELFQTQTESILGPALTQPSDVAQKDSAVAQGDINDDDLVSIKKTPSDFDAAKHGDSPGLTPTGQTPTPLKSPSITPTGKASTPLKSPGGTPTGKAHATLEPRKDDGNV